MFSHISRISVLAFSNISSSTFIECIVEFCKYISFSSAGVSPISSLISKAYSFKAKNLGSLYFAIGAFPDL